MRRRASGIRLYAAGAADTRDIPPSPLRELAYRLAGQAVAVEIVLPPSAIDDLDEADRYVLASMADHPNIAVRAMIGPPPRCGGGWLLAETLQTPAYRWAMSSGTALAFGMNWGESDGPLSLVKKWGPPRLIEHGESFPYVVVSPQCARSQVSWPNADLQHLLLALLEHILQN